MGQKGSKFERDLCRQLSRWWSGNRDDIFWRVGGSGGRAKFRGRSGRQTHGQHGDICATHPSGEVLIDLLTIELKRGYNTVTCLDVLDLPQRGKKVGKFREWFDQVWESHDQAGSYAWLLIVKRDMRFPIVFMPNYFYQDLRLPYEGSFDMPLVKSTVVLGNTTTCIVGVQLNAFLESVTPKDIKRLARTC